MKEKVINYLVKHGWNKKTAEELANNDYFDTAVKLYKTPARIADCLMCID